MHKSVRDELIAWVSKLPADIQSYTIADLGSYNINGSVKDIIPHVVGFDICAGPGVDVVISHEIDRHWKYFFDIVISVSAMQFSPSLEEFAKTADHLLKYQGQLFLTCCSDDCTQKHTTSPGTEDRWRPSLEVPMLFPNFSFMAYEVEEEGHRSIVFSGVKNDQGIPALYAG